MNILSEKNNDKNYVKAKIQKGLQNPKYQEKLRNARLCNNDKNPIHLPRQDLPGMMKSLKSSHKPRF